MSYDIILTSNFKKEAKKLIKKYPSLTIELQNLGDKLTNIPKLGTPLGSNVYKIRLAIDSKGKGKSGGARIISYVVLDNKTVLLLSIYNKGDKDFISDNEIKDLLNRYA